MTLKNILFPIPSPDWVSGILPRVASVARIMQADLTLMRIVNPFRDGGPRPACEEFRSIIRDEGEIDRCHIHIDAHSDAAASIIRYAREHGTDVIVLPAPRNSFRSVISRTRSLINKLLAQSPCPVWLMDSSLCHDSTPPNIQRILCAVSRRDLSVLKAAAEMSQIWNARLFLLHVIPEIDEGTLAFGFEDGLALSVENGMELLASLQKDAGTEATPLVQTGSPTKTIRRVAECLNVDLVVTGRINKGGKPRPAVLKAAPQVVIV